MFIEMIYTESRYFHNSVLNLIINTKKMVDNLAMLLLIKSETFIPKNIGNFSSKTFRIEDFLKQKVVIVITYCL